MLKLGFYGQFLTPVRLLRKGDPSISSAADLDVTQFFVGESISGEGVYVGDESHTYIAWPLPTQMVGGQKCTPFKCAMGQLLYEL